MGLSDFVHFLLTLVVSLSFLTNSSATVVVSSQPPEIILIEEIGNNVTVVTLNAHERQRHIPAKPVHSFQLKCQANYPIAWTSNSMEQDNVLGVESERTVTTFSDPATYKYSMTLKLLVNNTGNSSSSFVCQAVGKETNKNDFSNLTSVATMKWEDTVQDLVWSTESIQIWAQSNTMNDYDYEFNMTVTVQSDWHFRPDSKEFNVECCVRNGLANLRAWLGRIEMASGKCIHPLVCIRKTEAFSSAWTFWDKYVPVFAHIMCLSRGYIHSTDANEVDHIPSIISCTLKRMDGLARRIVVGQPRYYVLPTSRPSGLSYRTLKDRNKKNWTLIITIHSTSQNLDLTSAKFYIGDVLQLRCKASPHLFANGIIWEKRFKNGSSVFERGHQEPTDDEWAQNTVELSVGLMNDQLTTVSCHIPPWNSTGWVTHSIGTIVKRPSNPVTVSGHSFVQEDITFYTHELATLSCDLQGEPVPKYKWNTSSAAYKTKHSRNATNSFPVVIISDNLARDHTKPLPRGNVSCVASNFAGNATKVFNLQAIQSHKPAMANVAHETVVIYFGDRDALLNCSVTQGVPNPKFIWQRYGSKISTDNIKSGDKWSALVFKHVQPEDHAEYICLVSNELGSISKEFTVQVTDPPLTFWLLSSIIVQVILLFIFVPFLVYVWSARNRKISRPEGKAEFTKCGTDADMDLNHCELSTATVSTFAT